ncbi:MAG: DNA-binding protein [Chloroflexi bacterium]|nr:DNA-binding protein [Chloroflexota bacterium]
MFKKIHVLRVKPGEELLDKIVRFCKERSLYSGVIVGLIGSVESTRLNFLKSLPGNYETVEYKGPLEIVGAQGSVALVDKELVVHIHIHLSGPEISVGGHLVSAAIFSTAEVVIGELTYQLWRQKDPYTGLNELVI